MGYKRNLKRIKLQVGCEDRAGKSIEGLFEVLIDEDDISAMLVRAARNKSRMSSDGPVVVRYQRATKAQADYLIAADEKTAAQTSAEREAGGAASKP